MAIPQHIKSKIPVTLKWLVFVLAIGVVYQKLQRYSWYDLYSVEFHDPQVYLPLFLLLAGLNLFLDAFIWKIIHRIVEPIQTLRALSINLMSYALAFITPVNAGELAGRYFNLKDKAAKNKVLQLTFWSHFPRLVVKVVVLICASFWLLPELNKAQLWGLRFIQLLLVAGLVLIYFKWNNFQRWFQSKNIRNWQFQKYILAERPNLTEKTKLLSLAAFKFTTYNMQFICLLLLFGNVEFSGLLLGQVFWFYALSAFVPSVAAFDFLTKSAIGLVIFSNLPELQPVIVQASLLMWLCNVALPALAGNIVWLRQKKSPTATP